MFVCASFVLSFVKMEVWKECLFVARE